MGKALSEMSLAELWQLFPIRLTAHQVRAPGDWDELYFRDYLRQYPQAARKYEALKLELWKRFEHDRDGYTAAKGAFVENCTRRARQMWPGRYEPPASGPQMIP